MDRMLAGMTVRHLAEWRAYADLEPFDEVRADYRAASIVAAVINQSSKRKVKPSDVLLKFGDDAAPPVPSDPKAARQQVAAALNMVRAAHSGNRKSKRPRK